MNDQAPHLPVETLLAWVRGELNQTDVAAAEAHVAACGACSAELAMARETLGERVGTDLGERSTRMRDALRTAMAEQTPPSSGRSPQRVTPRRSQRWWGRGIVAAALVLIAIGAVEYLRPSVTPEVGQVVRGGEAAELEVSVDPGDASWQVQWEADRPALLRIVGASGEVVLSVESAMSPFAIPRIALEEFATAAPFFVQVTVEDDAGEPVRSTPVQLP